MTSLSWDPGARKAVPILLVGLCIGCQGLHDAAWSPPPLELLATSYIGAVIRSQDGGGNWLPLGSDPRPLQAYRKTLALDREGTIYVGTSGGGLFALRGEGEAYVEIPHEPRCGNIRALHYSPGEGILWIGTWGAGVYALHQDEKAWRDASEGLTAYHVNCLREDSHRGRTYCGTTTGLFERQRGSAWSKVPELSGLDVRDLLILPEQGFMCAAVDGPGGGLRFLISRDAGISWEPSDRGLAASSILCLALERTTGEILAGTSEGVFRRKVDGQQWERLGRTLSGIRVFSLVTAEGYTFAATARGLFGIAPGAHSWVDLNGSLDTSAVTDVVARARVGSVQD